MDKMYKIFSRSSSREIFDLKKEWLKERGIQYSLKNALLTHKEYVGESNFYWYFSDPEMAILFSLKWGGNEILE